MRTRRISFVIAGYLAVSAPALSRVCWRRNLIQLLPYLAHLQVFDNSAEAAAGRPIPAPILLLEIVNGKLVRPDPADSRQLEAIPSWAMPLVEGAIRLQDQS